METAVAYARAVFDGLLVAMIPSPERENYARDTGVSAPLFSFAVGLVQFLAGTGLFVLSKVRVDGELGLGRLIGRAINRRSH